MRHSRRHRTPLTTASGGHWAEMPLRYSPPATRWAPPSCVPWGAPLRYAPLRNSRGCPSLMSPSSP
eukprot:9334708-Alexandrium_andersonii.AAC.1